MLSPAGGARILLIDHDQKVATSLVPILEGEGFSLTHERSGRAGLTRARAGGIDIILLDLTLPDDEGLNVLMRLRAEGVGARLLVLTDRKTVQDRVDALNAGADDFVAKPFASAELVARVHALLRRAPMQRKRLHVGDLEVDLLTRDVRHAQKRVDLTGKEFDLLVYLMYRCGEVISRATLAREVYQQEHSSTIDNIIDVHVARVRKKLDEAGGRPVLQTVRGVGLAVATD